MEDREKGNYRRHKSTNSKVRTQQKRQFLRQADAQQDVDSGSARYPYNGKGKSADVTQRGPNIADIELSESDERAQDGGMTAGMDPVQDGKSPTAGRQDKTSTSKLLPKSSSECIRMTPPLSQPASPPRQGLGSVGGYAESRTPYDQPVSTVPTPSERRKLFARIMTTKSEDPHEATIRDDTGSDVDWIHPNILRRCGIKPRKCPEAHFRLFGGETISVSEQVEVRLATKGNRTFVRLFHVSPTGSDEQVVLGREFVDEFGLANKYFAEKLVRDACIVVKMEMTVSDVLKPHSADSGVLHLTNTG